MTWSILGEEFERMPGEYGLDGDEVPSCVEDTDGRFESSLYVAGRSE